MCLFVKQTDSDINSDEFAIYLEGAIYPADAICPTGEKRNLYHIATEQSEVISHFKKYIARTT